MKLFLSVNCLLFLAVMSISAQTDFAVGGTKLQASNDPNITRNMFQLSNLKWGKVESDCIGSNTVIGQWLTYSPRKEEATFIIRTGKGWGEIEAPILYLGTKRSKSGVDELYQIACSKAEAGQNEVRLSVKGLIPKQDYYLLITSKTPEKGQRYSAQAITEYDPVYDPTVKPEEPVSKRVVLGRLRKVNGEPKVGMMVTLLNESKETIESVKTDSEGMFHFKKLPPDETVMTRIEEDDTDLMVDVFLLDDKGNIESRATRIGDRLYGFGANENGFDDLKLLSEKDWKMNVSIGKQGVTGRVVDTKTFLFGQANLEVGLYDPGKKKLASTNTDKNGRFEFRDVDEGDYSVKLEGDREGKYSEMVIVDDLNVPFMFANSNNLGPDGHFTFKKLPPEIVEMKRMEVRDTQMPSASTDFSKMSDGKAIILKNILFASGSSKLLESSNAELDKLADELKKQASVKIEISGHTDNTGNPKTNQTLSESRAKAVKDYLVSKGISSDRMTHKGLGDSKPVASNDTEEGKKQNRRVEFVVVK